MGQKHLFHYAINIVAGVVIGVAFALWQTGQGNNNDTRPGAVIDDSWTTDLDIGSTNATGLLRARIARKGLFALSREEAVYYIRTTDGDGERLRPDCRYEIAGTQPPADWWSITLYGEDNFLLRNTDGAASINGLDPAFAGASWRVIVSAKRPQNNVPWISSDGAQSFDLMLRLYGPDLATLSKADFGGFPTIQRLDCSEGGA